ncbi:transmembrane protein 45A isoform X2 [Manis pentadactyla]|uniref:transmembrane protein 45A isoform X2 n=1 Tax=Manis pentadactyla TaxID=143292 RepID=UPI00255C7ECD|nr:transmembrane protein 45A isoform X2 [Manis pentadactyla]XP_057358119.1 transmembrane protein 45A isoform X2 [Manis pentadactyla]
MGNFRGHALPGAFFIIMGIWWTTKCVLKYACKKHKQTSYLGAKALFCRIEILEGIILVGMALTAFIFYNHTHGREMLDIFVHQLLVLAIFLAGLIAFMELLIRTNITVELLRTSFVFLQGSWFWQIGFVLYPPSGGPAWDSVDHDNIMFLTMCFCWHYALTFIIIGVLYAFVTWLVKSRLKRFCPSEVGLLKSADREQESEEEM